MRARAANSMRFALVVFSVFVFFLFANFFPFVSSGFDRFYGPANIGPIRASGKSAAANRRERCEYVHGTTVCPDILSLIMMCRPFESDWHLFGRYLGFCTEHLYTTSIFRLFHRRLCACMCIILRLCISIDVSMYWCCA